MKSIFPDNPEGMNIEWVVSNVCNYKCSYCTENLYGGSSGQPHYEKALDFFNYIHKNVQPGPKLLNLTGGEPTVWPRLIPFLKELDDSYHIQITTNGSRTLKWWKKLLQNCNKLARVCISVHLEFANIDHIYKVSELLHKKTNLTILLLADKKNFKLIKNNADKFTNLECTVFIKPVRDQNGKAQEYNAEELEFIKNFKHRKANFPRLPVPTNFVIDGEEKPYSYGLELISKNLHKFEGWKCGLGKTRLTIWHDGKIGLAHCNTARNLNVGNIYDETYSIPNDPVICDTEFCPCVADIRIPKWREDIQ